MKQCYTFDPKAVSFVSSGPIKFEEFAVRKVRQALKDDPERPRFVQTVTGKGYRFIAECRNGGSGISATPSIAIPAVAIPGKEIEVVAPKKHSWKLTLVAALVICIIFGAALALDFGGLRERIFTNNQIGPIHSIAVLPLTNLSGDPSQEYFSDGLTDFLHSDNRYRAIVKNMGLPPAY